MKLTKREYRLLLRVERRGFEFLHQLPEREVGRLRHLAEEGFVCLIEPDGFIGGITVKGRHEMEVYRDGVSDRWWTRGLAIIAILISVCALALEAQSRGWIGLPTLVETAPSQAPQPQAGAQESEELCPE